MERLPLFPLRVVLFPHTTLPLHIFEERYKLMIARCIEGRSPFGVVLIRSGEEVGGPAEPHDVGTSARIAQVQELPDGKMNLVVLGERRFRITALDRSAPYLQGNVDFLETSNIAASELEDAAARVSALFGEEFRLVLAISGQWMRRIDLPSDPDLLADTVAAHAGLGAAEKQELLETLSLPERLSRLTELLDRRVRALAERWEEQRRQSFAGARLN